MGWRLTLAGAALLVAVGMHAVARGQQQNPYRLKELNQGKLCLGCHSDFEEKLQKKFVHTAVRSGECAGCHSPHASAHGKLLSDDTRRICTTCHEGILPANAISTHRVAAEGDCVKCHDPHASDFPGNLVSKGNDLCVSCHAAIGDTIAKAKFTHRPVEQGCATCHDPHGSARAPALLKDAVPGLCLTCHKAESAAFVARHMRYPVEKADCTSCHDPHGADQPALLLNSVHPPVSSRTCTQCHQPPDSATPFATKREGFDLCKSCHAEAVDAMLAKARLHWPVGDGKGCVTCHNPHASRQPKLLEADTITLCGRCHSATVQRIRTVAVKHAPVDGGTCTTCHSPHSANNVHLMDQPSVLELCANCHDYQTHSAHPIGEQAVDPRNKNLRVDCLSCHDAHGTDHKWMLLAATNIELCTQCHKQFAR